jgi:transposase-like protein
MGLLRCDGHRLRETTERQSTMNEPVIQSKQTRKKYDKAFKQRAVELWLNSGKAATVVAAELGIHAQRLSAWRRRVGAPGARPRGGGGGGAPPPPPAPINSKPKTPVCGARTTICASNGIF